MQDSEKTAKNSERLGRQNKTGDPIWNSTEVIKRDDFTENAFMYAAGTKTENRTGSAFVFLQRKLK